MPAETCIYRLSKSLRPFFLLGISLCPTLAIADMSSYSGMDYPPFSPAAFFNRPISYWGVEVDDEATAIMRDYLVNSENCRDTHPGIALGGYSIYWVHDGDSDLKEYSIIRRQSTGDTPFTCTIPGRDPITTFRIPSNLKWSYPSGGTGNRDHHLFVIDVSRNVILSFYTYTAAYMGEMPTDPTKFMSEYVNCDLLHGADAALLAAETSRWKAGPVWTLPEQIGGVGGIGMGFGWPSGVTNGGNSVGGAVLPQDFVIPGQDDLGHVLDCFVPAILQNGNSWPAIGSDGPPSNPPKSVIRSGTRLRIDPNWTIPADTPEWEARILRTWQRYGCMIDDNDSPTSCLGTRGVGTWSGPGGSSLWTGVLPSSVLGQSNAEVGLSLTHFPAASIQVMMPIGPAYDMSRNAVTLSLPPPPFVLSHPGLLNVEPGQSASLTLTATLVSGSSQPVHFSVGNVPRGISCSFSPPSCTPTETAACSTTLTVAASATTARKTYEVPVTASMSSSQTSATTLNLAVGVPPLPQFVLTTNSNPGSFAVAVGQQAWIPIAAALLAGPPQKIVFASVSGLPADVTYSFDPASCTAPCLTTLSTSVFSSEGAYILTVVGTTNQGVSQAGIVKLAAWNNLIVNSGFETLTNGIPAPWSISPQNVTISNTESHWGSNSVKIEVGTDSALEPQIGQTINVNPETRYRVSFWTKQSSDASMNEGYVVQYDSNDAVVLDSHGYSQTAVPKPTPTPPDTWVLATADITTMSTTAQLRFYANIYHGTGTVWIDDVAVIRLLGFNGDPCTAAGQCMSGVCDAGDGKCGYPDGRGSCTASDAALVCRSGVCDGGTCGLASGLPSHGGCSCREQGGTLSWLGLGAAFLALWRRRWRSTCPARR